MAVNSELSDLIDAAANRSTSLLSDAKAAMGAGLQAINGIDTVANQVNGLALVAPQPIDLTGVNNITKPDLSPFSGLFSLSDFGNEPNAPGDDNLSYDGPGGFSGSRPGLPNTNDPVYKSPGTAPSNRPNAPGITAPTKPSALPTLNAQFPSLSPIGSNFSGTMPSTPTFGSPNVQEPVRPGPTPTFNKTAPKLNTPTGPSAPSAFSGTAPTMTSITLPAAPNSVIPSFNGQRPADVAAPGDAAGAFSSGWTTASAAFRAAVDGSVSAMLSRFNPQYDSALATMESKLAEMVRGDTETGFSPAVEQAIYGRSQSKQDAEARRVSDEAMSRAARMGFTMPSGSLMGSLQKARQAAADNNATASREIVVMQAEMQQKNMQFAITTSAQLRQAVMNAAISYHGNMIQLNGQAVQYANGIADAMTIIAACLR